MASIEEIDVTIPSETTAGQELQERIISIVEKLEFPPRHVFGLRLALEEALVNAIKHGNRFDANKGVKVMCRIDAELIHIEIEDEGEGFKLSEVPDPTNDENLDRPCGRGIMLMRHFLDVVEYNERGNHVVLKKSRDAKNDD